MPDTKLTDLPAVTTPTLADLLYTVQGGASSKITLGNLLANVPSIVFANQQTFPSLIVSGGPVAVNLGAVPSPTMLTVGDTASSTPRGIMSWQSSNDTSSAHLHLRKSRGTFAVPLTVAVADILGRVVYSGYDGSNYLEMASIRATVVGTVAATRIPTKLELMTATDAAPSVLTTALTLDQSQAATFAGAIIAPVTASLLNTVSTTINFGGAATVITVGMAGGAMTVNTKLYVVGNSGFGTIVPQGISEIVSTSNNTSSNYAAAVGALISGWSTGATGGPGLWLGRSRSATIGTHANVSAGDSLGYITFSGDSATASYEAAVQIRGEADAVTAGHVLGRLILSTSQTGGGMVERLRIDSAGLTTITGTQVITTGAVAAGANALTVLGGAHTAVVAEKYDLQISAHTITITGSFAAQRFTKHMIPTITAGSALTIDDATTLYIEGAPAVAGSAVITRPYALWVDAGAVRWDDSIAAPSTNVGVGIVNFYGASATNFLGEPNGWMRVYQGTSVFKIPLYS